MIHLKQGQIILGLIALTILTLTLSGCSSKSKMKMQPNVPEEAYIDLKQGFSLVIPADWKRARTPVSSPEHRQDTVKWLITKSNISIGSLQVTASNSTLENQPEQKQVDQEIMTGSDLPATHINHPAGPAMRWEKLEKNRKTIFLSIQYEDASFLLSCELEENMYVELLPSVERVFSSFRVLHN